MTPTTLLAALDASDAITAKATAPPWVDWDFTDDPCGEPGLVSGTTVVVTPMGLGDNDREFLKHARTALPLRNDQLRKLLDLLPWAQHSPGCIMFKRQSAGDRRDWDECNRLDEDQRTCTCGLDEKLKAAGVER